jgi:hypothetical protein
VGENHDHGTDPKAASSPDGENEWVKEGREEHDLKAAAFQQ